LRLGGLSGKVAFKCNEAARVTPPHMRVDAHPEGTRHVGDLLVLNCVEVRYFV